MKKILIVLAVCVFCFAVNSYTEQEDPRSSDAAEGGDEGAGREHLEGEMTHGEGWSWVKDTEGGRLVSGAEQVRTVLSPEKKEKMLSEDWAQFVIQPGDLIEVSVYGSEWMHHPGVMIRVPEDGVIFFPLLGDVEIGGLTAKQAAKKLDAMLMDGYLTDPKVSILILQYGHFRKMRMFSVSGFVREPGTFPQEGNVSVTDAINMAGGLIPGADTTRIKLIRIVDDELIEYYLDFEEDCLDFAVRAQDKVVVESSGNYFIYGEVLAPGKYYISKDLMVADAVLEARGFTETASRNGVKVIRYTDEGKKKVIRVPVAHIYRTGNKSKDVLIEDGDIIVVPESWF